MRTPETQTAAQRAERLRSEGAYAGDKARASLMSSPTSRSSAGVNLEPNAEADGSLAILSIDDIWYYDHNPRVGENPKYSEIRASMVANGMTSIITVTRRPGEQRYFPHAGGNTRLRIAKELAADGDQRFARLHVMVRAWTSESDVVAAHLGENENRGDTTFWEKALGVHKFKNAVESENPGRVMTGTELTRELKKQGTDFGVRMVQNFLFAVDHLAPIGPWLRTHEVNLVLRPRVGEYLELMQRFGRCPAAAAALSLQLDNAATGMHEVEARNRERDESEHRPVVLDAERLLSNIAVALADLLDISPEQLRRMSAALANDPRLQSKDLLSLPAPRTAPGAASAPAAGLAAGNASITNTSAAHTAQPALTAMPQRVERSIQRELGPMAGLVGGTSSEAGTTRETEHADAVTGTVASADGDPQRIAQRQARLLHELEQVITSVNGVVPIHDFVLRVPEMPFGFMVDIPADASHVGDADVSAHAGMRIVVWQFLAALSGQAHEIHWREVAELPFIQATRWSQKLAEGPAAFAEHLVGNLQVACAPVNNEQTLFDLFVGAVPLWTMFADERLGPLSVRLLQLRRALQDLEPQRHSVVGSYLKFPG
jgi:ParB family protein of integrating conjugative element (PFGI_1 class)